MFVEFLLFVLSFIFFGYLWLRYSQKKNAEYWKTRNVPMASPASFFSLFRSDWSFYMADVLIYNQLKHKPFGVFMEFGRPVFFITDLELVKRIYIKDFDHFVNRRELSLEKTDPHFHLSIVNQTGDSWKQLRSKMTPTFTTGKIRNMFPIFESSSQKLVENIKENLEKSKSESGHSNLDVREFLQKFTMDVIARVAFGLETDTFNSNSKFSQMGKQIMQMFSIKNIFKIVGSIMFGSKFVNFFNIKLTNEEADKFLSQIVIQTLRHREKTGEIRNDFIQLMIEARAAQTEQSKSDENTGNENPNQNLLEITDDLIIAQCLIFILGGFDTVESALIFSLYELAMNPDVQDKLRKEIDEILKTSEEGKLTYDNIQNIEYLDMILSESLRKYPPAFRTDRKATHAYKIPDSDIIIPKDSIVVLPIYAIHHDPEIWPDPEKFNPLRFTKEEVAKRHPCAYQAFGMGPRNCVANRYALAECKTLIAHIILNFNLEPSEKTENPPIIAKNAGSFKPKNGMWLKVTSRK